MIKRVPAKRLGRGLGRLNSLKHSDEVATKPAENKAAAALFEPDAAAWRESDG
jgi:hypothetical protein